MVTVNRYFRKVMIGSMVLGTVGLTQVSLAQQPENPADHSAHGSQEASQSGSAATTGSGQVFDSSQLTQQSQNGMHQGQGSMMQHGQDGQAGMMQRGQDGQGGMMQHGQDGQGGMMQHGQDGQGGMMQHGQDGQGGMMQNGQGDMMQRMERMRSMMGMSGGAQVNAGGQDAFSAIRAVVSQLEADANTDWSRINIAALQNHLIDMQELTINARVETEQVDGGAIYRITGRDRTLEAIRNMVPMHASQMNSETSWTSTAEEIRNGIELTVTAESEEQVQKIRALGFIGFMVSGGHHDQHHLAIVGADMGNMSEAAGGGHSH